MPAYTQLPSSASPPASPSLPALEYPPHARAHAAVELEEPLPPYIPPPMRDDEPMHADGPSARGFLSRHAGHSASSSDMRDSSPAREEKKQESSGVMLRRVPRSLRPFHVHQWLDVKDTQDTWLEAQVTALDPPGCAPTDDELQAAKRAMLRGAAAASSSAAAASSVAVSALSSSGANAPPTNAARAQQRIMVHYKGFHSKYDEWLDVSSAHTRDTARIAPLHTHTKEQHVVQNIEPMRGRRIDCKDTVGRWYPSTILDYHAPRGQVLVQYEGFEGRCDEWINMDSYRLQPLGSFTSQAVIQPIVQQPPRARHPRPHQSSSASASSSSQPSSSAAVSAERIAQFQASSDNERRFRQLLRARLGSDIIDQKEDGNCLFRSVSHQVYGDAAHHELVRAATMAYIEAEKDFFLPFIANESFDAYLGRMRTLGEWGDNVELQAMSEIYERPIEIYAYSHTPLKTFMSATAAPGDGSARRAPPPIRLSYHFASHYNSVTHPLHHQAQCSTLPPGVMEEAAMQRVAHIRRLQEQQRAAVAAAASASASAPALPSASPEIPGSLSRCRSAFRSSQLGLAANPDAFDQACQSSLAELDAQWAAELARAQTESLREADDAALLQAACAQSEREEVEQQLAAASASAAAAGSPSGLVSTTAAASSSAVAGASKSSVEDEVLKRALAASLAAAPAALSEEEQLEQAMRLSVAAHTGAGAGSSSPEDAALQSALRASAAEHPSAQQQLPGAVRACVELGFSLEQCVQAFHVCGGDSPPAGVDKETQQQLLVQRMMDYLCSS